MLVKIFHQIFSNRFAKAISHRLDLIYSKWISYEFNSTGNGFHIKRPILLHGGKFISIGDNFHCDVRLQLEAFDNHLGFSFSPKIHIGNNVGINLDCHICAINYVEIGNNVLIASKVFITDHFHGKINLEAIQIPPSKRQLYSKGPVIIKDNVWIGEGVVIMPNVVIGSNAIIGANSVVTKDVPQNAVVGGNPAKIIRII
jgi:acetyltransferase-like isoleucine patch superfamily enzyme